MDPFKLFKSYVLAEKKTMIPSFLNVKCCKLFIQTHPVQAAPPKTPTLGFPLLPPFLGDIKKGCPSKPSIAPEDLSVLRILRVFRHLAEENLSWRNLTLTPLDGCLSMKGVVANGGFNWLAV